MIEDKKIPKIIHYCWFGGKPLPNMARKCIKSWEKYLPDYDIKEWNESNFDINVIPYVREAYDAKKYAFVSDYARFWILYNHGGVYFDTDVEVIRPIDDIISKGPFMGCQNKYNKYGDPLSLGVAPGLGLAAYKGQKFYKRMLDLYEQLNFKRDDGTLNLTTIVNYTTEVLCQQGLINTPDIQCVDDIFIYPWDYFCPMTPTLELNITQNSRTIHLYSASWESWDVKLRKFLKRRLGYRFVSLIQPLFNKLADMRKK